MIEENNTPNVILAGAMKSGTTSLANMMADHHQICVAIPKEPTVLIPHDYIKTPEPVRRKFDVPIEQQYAEVFNHCMKDQLRVDASVAYMPSASSALMAKKINPEMKIIFIMRDPIKRAISSYYYTKSTGLEFVDSIEKAIEEDISGIRDNYWPALRHAYYGRYDIHIQQWLNYFRRDQLLLLDFGDFKRNPNNVMNSISRFLEIDSFVHYDSAQNSNPTVNVDDPIRSSLMKFLYDDNIIKTNFKKLLPMNLRQNIKYAILDKIATRDQSVFSASDSTIELLDKYYANTIRNLRNDFGMGLSEWGK